MEPINLTDHFLIAMPGMADPIFSKCLMYICEHHEQGALGIVVNRPTAMTLAGMFGEIGIESDAKKIDTVPIYFGGPVEIERGFVLHEPVGQWQATIAINDSLGLTSSKDILYSIGSESGPMRMLIALGYAGWAPGQLEHELSQNAWLTVKSSHHIMFELPAEERFYAAMQLLGIEPGTLSDSVGHA